MIVVVEKDLEYVKQYLEAAGKYEVKLNSEYVGPMDAYVFTAKEDMDTFSNFENNVDNRSYELDIEVKPGILIINASQKSPKDIEKILDDNLMIRMWQ